MSEGTSKKCKGNGSTGERHMGSAGSKSSNKSESSAKNHLPSLLRGICGIMVSKSNIRGELGVN